MNEKIQVRQPSMDVYTKQLGEGRKAHSRLAAISDEALFMSSPAAEKKESTAMPELTRETLDTKLETMEVKMDGRVASIEAKIDGFMGRLEEKFGRMDDRMTRIESDLSSTRSDFKSLKTTIVITAIASVIGLFAANVTMVQTMLASFESGRNVSSAQAGIVAAQSDIKRQTEETSALLKQLQKDHPSASSRP